MNNEINISESDTKIVLDHGTGALLSRELVRRITNILGDVYLGEMEDSAILPNIDGAVVMTTDSFVVDPFIFGNGDIGKIAVCGTVNDLAVMGAEPKYLTLGLILEAGLDFQHLDQILYSIRDAASEANIKIVAGDTKVVATGEADKIFINTAGIGILYREALRMSNVQVGDRLILTGWLGDHSIHLLSIREGLGYEERVKSDCAPLNAMINDLLNQTGDAVHSIRDVTRGGLSAVVHEFAQTLDCNIQINAKALPIRHEVIMATDMLGVNALNLANEGCLAIFVAPECADKVIQVLKTNRYGEAACEIGEVINGAGHVLLRKEDGSVEMLEELIGAEIPRLC